MKCVNSAPIVMFIVVLNAVILDSVLQAVTSFEWVEARFGEVLYSRNARFAPNGEAVFYEEYDSFEKQGISNNMLHSSRNFFDDGKVLHQSYDMTSYGGTSWLSGLMPIPCTVNARRVLPHPSCMSTPYEKKRPNVCR
ncbi:hypothetical protein B6A42_25765 (plasmid) [Vibrio coralliilyticus]|nr:hypothetical protein B6A42_25765 [Vibrio coralliilyticus]